MIKIFYPGKIFHLISDQKLFVPSENAIMASITSREELLFSFKKLVGQNDLKEICFFSPDKTQLFDDFSSMFRIIVAAGGLVRNEEGKYLFIFRNGKWDLPKGKTEKRESVITAAVREVEEECGISGLKNVKELITTYHIYSMEEKLVMKPTHWFSMEVNGSPKLIPQQEEGITDVRWLAKNEFAIVKKNTFPAILEVVAKAR